MLGPSLNDIRWGFPVIVWMGISISHAKILSLNWENQDYIPSALVSGVRVGITGRYHGILTRQLNGAADQRNRHAADSNHISFTTAESINV